MAPSEAVQREKYLMPLIAGNEAGTGTQAEHLAKGKKK